MISLCMIVAALLEFAVVLMLKHHRCNTKPCPNKDINVGSSDDGKSRLDAGLKMQDQSAEKKEAWALGDNTKTKELYEKIDYACFFIFAIVSVLFNAVYFSVYISV